MIGESYEEEKKKVRVVETCVFGKVRSSCRQLFVSFEES